MELILLTLVIASSLIPSLHAQALNCGTTSQVGLNASGQVTTYKPFELPFGPNEEDSETWTWTLDTVSYDMDGSNGTAENRLYLSTQAQVGLTEPDFGFLGCGMIMHGLRHGTIVKGQNDEGNCLTIFDSGCLRALDNSTNLTSQALSPLAGSGNALDLCSRFANLGTDGAFGLPDECSGAFDPDAWIQTFVFASPQPDAICGSNPGAGSQFEPIAAWGASPYSTGDMIAYDNLTTSVVPLMVTMFTNRTVNDTQASQLFTGQELLCLRPDVVEAGSAQPTFVPNAAHSNVGIPTWSIVAGAVGLGLVFLDGL